MNIGSKNKIYDYIASLKLSQKINYQIIENNHNDNIVINSDIDLLFFIVESNESNNSNMSDLYNFLNKNKHCRYNKNIPIINLSPSNSLNNYLTILRYHLSPNLIEKELMSKMKLSDIIHIDHRSTNEDFKMCPICFNKSDIFIENKLCHHRVCIKCIGPIVYQNKTYPFCRGQCDISHICIMKKYIPSFYDYIASILDDLKEDLHNNNIVIYMYSDHLNKLADRLNYIDSIIISPDKSYIDILNQSNYGHVIITETNNIINKIENIKHVICLSTHNMFNIIKNNSSYGNDFIKKKSKTTLHLIEI